MRTGRETGLAAVGIGGGAADGDGLVGADVLGDVRPDSSAS
jgi:hypothetical protein